MNTLFFSTIPAERSQLESLVRGHAGLDVVPLALSPESCSLLKGCKRVVCLTQSELADEVWQNLIQSGVSEVILAGPVHTAGRADADSVSPGGMIIRRIPVSTPQTEAQWTLHQILGMLAHEAGGSQLLNERHIGILGFGRTGKILGQMFHGFGCRTLAWDQQPDRNFAFRYGIEFADLDILLSRSDILTIQLPFVPSLNGFLREKLIRKAPKGLLITNVGHPALLELENLADQFRNGQIAGYSQVAGPVFSWSDQIGTELWKLGRMPQVRIDWQGTFDGADAIRNRIRLALKYMNEPSFA